MTRVPSVSGDLRWQSAADLVKVGAEGYIHGYICVRPPCGKKTPGHISASELSVAKDGTVVHKPSGYAVGKVKKTGSSWTPEHASGTMTPKARDTRSQALSAIVRHHNKTVKDAPSAGSATASTSQPDIIPQRFTSRIGELQSRNVTLNQLTYINRRTHAYNNEQIEKLSKRLDSLEHDLKGESKREKFIDLAIEAGSVLAAIGLAIPTGGLSLAALLPILHDKAAEIGKVVAKGAIHVDTQRLITHAKKVAHVSMRHVREKTPAAIMPTTAQSAARRISSLMSAEKSADASVVGQASETADLIAAGLTQGGMDSQDARDLASALVQHAAACLAMGGQPWEDGFGKPLTDNTEKIEKGTALTRMMSTSGGRAFTAEKSAQTPELSSTHHPLGTHGLWGDKTAQLPAYIQNIAHAMIRGGHDESSAIALAIGAVKRWARGGGKVSPEVRAASAKALAEWEKLKVTHNKTKMAV